MTAPRRLHAPGWLRHLPAGAAPEDVDLLRRRSLPSAWSAVWNSDPVARVLHGAGTGWLTASELETRSARVAGRLSGALLQRGDRIILSAESSVDLVVAYAAALRMGLVVVPLNTAYTEREVAHIVADARPAAAVVDDTDRAHWIKAAAAPSPTLVVGTDVALPDVPIPRLDDQQPEEPALICYTSGTTGLPKGAVLSHGNLLASAEAVVLAWRWHPDDRLILTLPLFHMHGLGVGLNGTLLAGAAAVLMPKFDPAAVLDASAEHGASLFFGVPTMYSRLAASPRLGELSSLRLCVSGSAPLPPDLHSAIAERGRQQIIERYGMTETLMNVSNPYDGERRPGTVGFPLPGVEVSLVDGEIFLAGPNIFDGYWDQPGPTADAFTEDGWFRSGDLGSYDADGYLRIEGRRKELIISGGLNVYPREVEDVLRKHPAVEDVAVVGSPSDEWGEVVTAFVVSDGGCDESALVAFAAGYLASYKRPRVVRFVDELPRNALGKVLKHELTT